ncbi:uncharacterized protein [Zea mays]|uniref:uncharacterized protein isoform X2 n=1 Tax=Zea mays TaxID=4577 RepID=UPI0004DEACDA|nr:uncharacterized protein LOC103649555 isoform X2 [Zea mays]|eukprot:XP_008673500.1 uncharacterized protein LOC103649555 isoform X2 [Zea mays]
MMDHGRMAVEASQPKPGAGQKGTMAKRGRGGEFPVSFLKGDEHRSPLLSSSSPSHMLLYRRPGAAKRQTSGLLACQGKGSQPAHQTPALTMETDLGWREYVLATEEAYWNGLWTVILFADSLIDGQEREKPLTGRK